MMPSRPARHAPSIRRTLWLYLGALSALGAVLLFFGARDYGKRAANRSYDHLLLASSLSILDNVARVDGRWRVDLPDAFIDVLSMAPRERVFYRVSDSLGRTVAGRPDLPRPRRHRGGAPVFFDARYGGEDVRFSLITRRMSSAGAAGVVHVQVGQTRHARDALASDMVLRALGAIALLSALSLALVGVGVHRALRPLARIQDDLARRDPGNLQPLDIATPREMAQVVSSLNRFMARLAESNEAQSAFLAEAAHQMRTPLTTIHAQAQLALEDIDGADRLRCLQVIERNAGQMGRLLNQLLSDASVNHRTGLHHFEPVDLADVLRQAVRDVVPATLPRHRAPVVVAPDPAWVLGDALLLREAIKNLLDNALKYGGKGMLQVALSRGGAGHVLTIADHGPGIPATEAEHVFDRFVCGEGAPPGSAGLGLAIVRRVLDSHGGRIQLGNRPRGGLVVILRMPALRGT